jgi:proteasome assembly chaperone (PAC2) family protein
MLNKDKTDNLKNDIIKLQKALDLDINSLNIETRKSFMKMIRCKLENMSRKIESKDEEFHEEFFANNGWHRQ